MSRDETDKAKVDERYQKAFPVSWDQFHRDARALAWRLSGEGPFSAVVAVTRGGLVPAAVVARELGVRVIETICVASYEYGKQGDLAEAAARVQAAHPAVRIGSYPHHDGKRFTTRLVLRSRDAAALEAAAMAVEAIVAEATGNAPPAARTDY